MIVISDIVKEKMLFCFSLLLQAGVNIDDKDNDGWTPLHAAAHWGQEESCKILAENMCDMEAKNLAVSVLSQCSAQDAP